RRGVGAAGVGPEAATVVLVQSPPLDQQLASVQEKDGKGPVEQPLSVGFLLFHPAHRAVRLIYQDHIRHRRRSLPKSRAKASSIVPSKGSRVNLPGAKRDGFRRWTGGKGLC